ncbi:MAG TPA: molybdopterin synthase sulfur carrier subunit [Cyanothece sp. UBA12306]|nr:molybdopterin synthase sulfur carrier subunit [Cyanothece sp. UBA12306]
MNITVKLFAAYQEAYGLPELNLKLSQTKTVKAVLEDLIAEHPELKKWQDVTRFGVNFHFVDPDTLLKDGDELVLIPPVSGG